MQEGVGIAPDGPYGEMVVGFDDRLDSAEGVWGMYSTQLITLMILMVIGAGTVVYRYLEDWGWVDSFYFTVITLTTVGYGDLAPSSSGSKLFTVFYIAAGISLLGAALNEVLKRRGRRMAAKRVRRTS
jgi:voltage-gated potassium channel